MKRCCGSSREVVSGVLEGQAEVVDEGMASMNERTNTSKVSALAKRSVLQKFKVHFDFDFISFNLG